MIKTLLELQNESSELLDKKLNNQGIYCHGFSGEECFCTSLVKKHQKEAIEKAYNNGYINGFKNGVNETRDQLIKRLIERL